MEDYGEPGEDISAPDFVRFWHEIGHNYYGGGMGKKVDHSACKAVDLENQVLEINHLKLRDYIRAKHDY